MNSEHSIWVEKWRPTELSEYVGNSDVINAFNKFLEEGDIPHILLHSNSPGTGKTTAAKLLASKMDADVKYINASDERNIDTVRDSIKTFVSTIGFGKFKIVILDEFDFMTVTAMASLRNIMETFAKSSRFILTCNYIEKVLPPIISRCQVFSLHPPSKKEVAVRVSEILKAENVKHELKDLASFVNNGYPDMRRIINDLQQNTSNGELKMPSSLTSKYTYLDEILDTLKNEKSVKSAFTKCRQILADAKLHSFDELYSFLYDNLDEYATGHVAPVIITLAESQYQAALAVDKEITASACLAKILMEIKS